MMLQETRSTQLQQQEAAKSSKTYPVTPRLPAPKPPQVERWSSSALGSAKGLFQFLERRDAKQILKLPKHIS